jgi:hypothetical protein
MLVPLALAANPGQAQEFFQTHVENMLLREFYVPTATDARLSDGADFSAAFSISNTLNAELRGAEGLLVDGESDTLRFTLDEPAGDAWRYRLSVPLIHDSGGFLDPAIDWWHRAFGLQQGNRPNFPANQLRYDYAGVLDGEVVRAAQNQAASSIGGVAAEAGWYAADSGGRTLSFWGGLQMPTGSVSRLTGDGTWDAALWAHWARRGALWQVALEAGITQPFGDRVFAGFAHHPAGFGRTAATRSFGSRWSLRAQLDGQSRRVDDSQLRFLGASLQLTLGACYRMQNGWRVDFGFTEDALVDTAPDVTFFFVVHH